MKVIGWLSFVFSSDCVSDWVLERVGRKVGFVACNIVSGWGYLGTPHFFSRVFQGRLKYPINTLIGHLSERKL